jgi:hypothetical protein
VDSNGKVGSYNIYQRTGGYAETEYSGYYATTENSDYLQDYFENVLQDITTKITTKVVLESDTILRDIMGQGLVLTPNTVITAYKVGGHYNAATGQVEWSSTREKVADLVLTNQTSMQAFTPYILYAPNGYEGTLTGTVDAEKYAKQVTDGYLTGTVVAHEVTGGEGHYVLQNQGEGPMFYRVGETSFNIPAGKCWLSLPASQHGVSALQLHRPTGIETIPVNTLNSSAVYDLSGRKVTNPTKGLYIVGGKKVLK